MAATSKHREHALFCAPAAGGIITALVWVWVWCTGRPSKHQSSRQAELAAADLAIYNAALTKKSLLVDTQLKIIAAYLPGVQRRGRKQWTRITMMCVPADASKR